MSKVVIVGAGQAGGRVAVTLRSQGFDGEILLLGEESHPPYKRPPLSKTVLQGKSQVEDGYLLPVEAYAEKQIDLRLNCRVEKLETSESRVYFGDGMAETFDHLVLATGGIPRNLNVPGSELKHIFLLRTAQDAERIRAHLDEGKRVVIIGGGFIGLEVAASARQLGCEVTVLEALDRLLSRSLPEQVAEAVVKVHEVEGVTVKTGMDIVGFGGDGGVSEVKLEGQQSLPADLVVIGIGITPATELAEAVGIKCENGILTDEYGQTSIPDVYAVGDCARALLPRYAENIRLESFQNADQQAANVVASIMGDKRPYNPVPFIWSDQYKRILQTAGFPAKGEQHIQRGTLEDENMVLFSLKDGKLIGVTGWGKGALIAKDVRFSQMLMEKGKSVTAEQLANPDIAIKDLLNA